MLHSCSCISTAGISVPNHTSRVKALQLFKQTYQRLWLTRQPNCFVQQYHLKVVAATWCKHCGGWELGLGPQMGFRLPGRKQRCSWYPFLQPVCAFGSRCLQPQAHSAVWSLLIFTTGRTSLSHQQNLTQFPMFHFLFFLSLLSSTRFKNKQTSKKNPQLA